MPVGDIVPCPNWYHSDHCTAPDCRNERNDRHADCEICGGTKRVRITVDEGSYLECEPLAPASEERSDEATRGPHEGV